MSTDALMRELVAWALGVLLRIGLVLIVLAVLIRCALAAEQSPPCDPALPVPPLVVVLPDGTEIPASGLEYDLAARRIVVTGDPRIFCSTFD